MHLLNLTLQAPTAISLATVGSFSGTKGQEILVVRGGTRLEILKLNMTTGACTSSLLLHCLSLTVWVDCSGYDMYDRGVPVSVKCLSWN